MSKKLAVLVATGCVAAGLSAWAGGACCGGSAAAKTEGEKVAAAGEAKAGCAAGEAKPACAAGEVKAAGGAGAEVKAQSQCPVMGGAVNKSIYVDHGGKRVYLCCNACVSTFKADPEKYVKQLAEAGVQLEEAPSAQ
ncbi:MAG: hypothetical protein KA248_04475 [Kiritimatiellae bacterium]|nr:hypothetical protein [Kiritimatiellia bacterium]